MKIIKSAERAKYLKEQKEKATENCKYCPSCGRKVEFEIPVCRHYSKIKWFKIYHYEVSIYNCKGCGTVWESDEYEYA